MLVVRDNFIGVLINDKAEPSDNPPPPTRDTLFGCINIRGKINFSPRPARRSQAPPDLRSNQRVRELRYVTMTMWDMHFSHTIVVLQQDFAANVFDI